MNIYAYSDYRTFLIEYMRGLPNQGYGYMTKLAEACEIHTTLMSLVLKGDRDLNLDQAYRVSQFLGLSPAEMDFFSLLVQFQRAADHKFKNYLFEKIVRIRNESNKVKNRFKHDLVLDDISKQVFYSSFLYSAIRLYCDTEKSGISLNQLVEKFQIERTEMISKLDFLVKSGLVIESKGLYKIGLARTLVDRDSIHVVKHHQNWRLQALLKAERLSAKELMFTCPMALSESDFNNFRSELAELIQNFSKMLTDSKSEKVGCFNLDWFYL